MSVMEMAKQTEETLDPVKFAFFEQRRTKDMVKRRTNTQSFWNESKISFAGAKMQPHLNEVI